MNYDPNLPRRRSTRLAGYDYSQVGAYFVTIVTHGRSCCFGDADSGEMRLSDAGRMACRVWKELPARFVGIEMDYFIVMPNHLHGIIIIHDGEAGVKHQPTASRATTRVAPTLGNVVGAYKSLTTMEYTRGVKTLHWPPFEGRLWQRNYYEHIIRDGESLNRLRQYITDNPAQWAFDRENPVADRGQQARPF